MPHNCEQDSEPLLFGIGMCAGAAAVCLGVGMKHFIWLNIIFLTPVCANFFIPSIFSSSSRVGLLGFCLGTMCGLMHANGLPTLLEQKKLVQKKIYAENIRGIITSVEYGRGIYTPVLLKKVFVEEKNICKHYQAIKILIPPGERLLTGSDILIKRAMFLPPFSSMLPYSAFCIALSRPEAINKTTSKLAEAIKKLFNAKLSAVKQTAVAKIVIGTGNARVVGMVCGLIFGQKNLLDNRIRIEMKNGGLLHLLAVSGLHMNSVGTMSFFVSKWAAKFCGFLFNGMKYSRPFIVLSSILSSSFFLALSGFSISATRAYIMFFTKWIIYGSDSKIYDSQRAWALAIILILISDSKNSINPGFQLSFAASGALIFCSNQKKMLCHESIQFSSRWKKKIVSLSQYVFSSIFTTAVTVPIVAYHFQTLNISSFALNLIAIPIASYIMLPFAISIAIFSSVFENAPKPLVKIFETTTNFLILLTKFANNMMPPTKVSQQVLYLPLLFFVIAVLSTKKHKMFLLAAGCFVFCLALKKT